MLMGRLNGLADVVTCATLAGVDAPVMEVAGKARLRSTTGAAAAVGADLVAHLL
jgi:hypothetical protein